MRIIAGRLGGRVFQSGNHAVTHGMSEKVRGALFNILGDVTDKTILDAFAGTGAIGVEALSRGARSALMIEKDRSAAASIKTALSELGLQNHGKVVAANCRSWSENNPSIYFDIIICDPPYHDMQLSTVNLLTRHMKSESIMVVSHPGRGGQVPAVNGVVVVDNRSYGDAALSFYRLG